MDRQDRDAIEGLFRRIARVEQRSGPRDRGAEALISAKIGQQPAAPYYMAQTILMQEKALNDAQARIEELENGGYGAGRRGGRNAGPWDNAPGFCRRWVSCRCSADRYGRCRWRASRQHAGRLAIARSGGGAGCAKRRGFFRRRCGCRRYGCRRCGRFRQLRRRRFLAAAVNLRSSRRVPGSPQCGPARLAG